MMDNNHDNDNDNDDNDDNCCLPIYLTKSNQ